MKDTLDGTTAVTVEDYHPSPAMLERFLSGALSAAECRALVRHLLTGCPVCRPMCGKITGRLWGPGRRKVRETGPRAPRTPRAQEERQLAVVD